VKNESSESLLEAQNRAHFQRIKNTGDLVTSRDKRRRMGATGRAGRSSEKIGELDAETIILK